MSTTILNAFLVYTCLVKSRYLLAVITRRRIVCTLFARDVLVVACHSAIRARRHVSFASITCLAVRRSRSLRAVCVSLLFVCAFMPRVWHTRCRVLFAYILVE
jgi:hypothetical protein